MGSKGFPYLDEALQSTQLSTKTYGNDVLWRMHCFQCRSPDAYNTDNCRDMSGCLVCSSMPVGSAGNEKEWIACIGGGSCDGEPEDMLRDLPIWPRSGTSRAWGLQIYQALMAIERCTQNSASHSQSLVSNSLNFPLRHELLIRNLLSYAEQERTIRNGGREQVCHQNESMFQVLNHAKSHMMIFGDDVHWRVICMDGQARKVYCIDPYGDKASISFYSRSARSVLQTLQDVLAEQGSSEWTLQVTTHPWQNSCDGHSCGIWVAWLCERFMQFVTDRPEEPDFERWASAQYSIQSALRARYHDMYYQQHPEENPLQASEGSSSPADRRLSQNSRALLRTASKLTTRSQNTAERNFEVAQTLRAVATESYARKVASDKYHSSLADFRIMTEYQLRSDNGLVSDTRVASRGESKEKLCRKTTSTGI